MKVFQGISKKRTFVTRDPKINDQENQPSKTRKRTFVVRDPKINDQENQPSKTIKAENSPKINKENELRKTKNQEIDVSYNRSRTRVNYASGITGTI